MKLTKCNFHRQSAHSPPQEACILLLLLLLFLLPLEAFTHLASPSVLSLDSECFQCYLQPSSSAETQEQMFLIVSLDRKMSEEKTCQSPLYSGESTYKSTDCLARSFIDNTAEASAAFTRDENFLLDALTTMITSLHQLNNHIKHRCFDLRVLESYFYRVH